MSMNRRQFVQASVATTVAAGVEAHALAPKPAKKMNILYVFGDQHRWCAMPGHPLSDVVAPNFEKFRGDNFEMKTCVSNYPLCTPYRAILQSGRYPSQTGVLGNGYTLQPAPTHLANVFQSAGYHTAYVGKWHLDRADNHFIPAGPMRLGYEDWQMWCQTNNHYHAWTFDQKTGEKQLPEGWQPVPMTDEAITRLKAMPKGPDAKPFFMVLSWNPPHPPYNPPDAMQKPYAAKKLQRRPNVRLGVTLGNGKINPHLVSEDTYRETEDGYYGAITGIDEQFGRLLAALKETGFEDDTIVIYTSDHGEMMGGHAHIAKQVPFEESCRVPFFIRVPGKTKAGGSSTEIFSAIDMYPTLLGLAGVAAPSSAMGRDLSGVILGTGTASATPGTILLNEAPEGEDAESSCPTYRGIRTETHTYAVNATGRWILYDNANDPFQLKNLVNDPSQKGLMDKLDDTILAWQKTCGDKFPLKSLVGKISNEVS
jgi:arylsulfatase A-like enzyme